MRSQLLNTQSRLNVVNLFSTRGNIRNRFYLRSVCELIKNKFDIFCGVSLSGFKTFFIEFLMT